MNAGKSISADPDSLPGLFALLREDWAAHGPRPLSKPGFHALALHRFGYWQRRLPLPARVVARVVHDAVYYITRVFYGIELPATTRVGRRVVIGHQGGIVIGWHVEIGDDCLIRQNVTIGSTETGGGQPRIGARVAIGAGAVIVGSVVVGDDVVIGPNAVVAVDVPPGARVVSPPGRIIVGPGRDVATSHPPVDAPSAADVLSLVKEVTDVSFPLAADTPLLSSGLVDSLALAGLVSRLEEQYGVVIENERVTAAEFDSAEQIAAVLADVAPRRP